MQLDGIIHSSKGIPDRDIAFLLKNASATALNNFTNHYTSFGVNSGTLALYSAIAITDRYLKRSVTPLLFIRKLIEKKDRFLEIVCEDSSVTLATDIPIEGDLNNKETGMLRTTGGILKYLGKSLEKRN